MFNFYIIRRTMVWSPGSIIAISVIVFVPLIYLFDHDWIGTNNIRNGLNKDITQTLINNVDSEKIMNNLRFFTNDPHTAGTEENKRVAEKIANTWKENGLQDVHFINYNVLLNYPNYEDPNHVTIFDSKTNETVFKSAGLSPVILPSEQGAAGAGIQWLAYAPGGTVEADVVYCHYGNTEDFQKLNELGVSVKGKISLMRYDGQWRGSKILRAQKNGAIGAILYSDPMEYASDGTDAVYPQTVWMPSGGVQRGSLLESHGDPLTPLYPARNDLFQRRTLEEAREAEDLPSIPALPLSYGDAYQILIRLDGADAPSDWQGALNFTYKLGPGFKANTEGNPQNFRMKVNSYFENREIRNVIGYIYGAEDPDEYVILGNHYDAWVYGAIDPNSGTATLAEVARAFTQTIRDTAWRPARTLVFCAWDAEEYGLIGSTEFVEDFANILTDRAVIYLNVDLISANSTLNADTIPHLYKAVVDTSREIPNPLQSEVKEGRKTIYDTWIKHRPSNTIWLPDYPKMKIPGGGSDHSPFLTYLGVPVVDLTYQNSSQVYPLYHTLYETPFVNEHLYDVDHFSVHRAMAQYWAELARKFSDAEILPLNISTLARKILVDYVSDLKGKIDSVKMKVSPDALKPALTQLSYLIEKCQQFISKSNKFMTSVTALLNEHPASKLAKFTKKMKKLSGKRINQRLKAIDRCFVNPRGSPTSQASRHVLYSLSTENSYSGNVMPAVYSQLEELLDAKTEKEELAAGRKLAQEISIIQYSIQCAINTICDSI